MSSDRLRRLPIRCKICGYENIVMGRAGCTAILDTLFYGHGRWKVRAFCPKCNEGTEHYITGESEEFVFR